ncbi:hypothetical protein A5792_27960 [Mycolicibacterium peregrinum]|uniref:Uncharacterized protein n=1 Tax=Mycolicibacterium peregrinum TaxID=43304 RepID=A0A1A0QTV3_MYCPR|nr:hypothetical protein [Mycolicibacterium peregrinum]OBB25591.1 hypothetical protein A5792_27960 [Mycolicibacterium peregrinum]
MKTSGYLRLALVCAILIGGAGFTMVWTVIWSSRGSYLTAALCVGASLLLFSLLFHLAYPATGAAHPRVEYGPGGTKMRPQRYADLIFSVGLLLGVLSAGAFLIFAQFDMVDFIPSGTNRLILPAGCIFYVIYGVPVLYRIYKHQDGKHLRLDPHGFELWDGQWNSFAHGTWDDVEQILDHPLKGKVSFTDLIVFVLPKGRSAKLGSGTITANSHALREWVRFYWQHPDCRDELTDGRALQRLDDEKFTIR